MRRLGKVGLAIGVSVIVGLPTPSIAQSCQLADVEAPSDAMRSFGNTALGLSLDIPINYRTVLEKEGHIAFHDPGSFEYVQCLANSGQYGAVPLHAKLEVYKEVNPNADLVELVRQRRPWVDFYNPEYVAIEIAGHPALQYEYVQEIVAVPIANISFIAGDGQTLMTLSGPAQHPILANAFTSLAIYPTRP